MRSFGRAVILFLVACACVGGTVPVATESRAAERFFSVIDDLPIMASLAEIPGSAIVYSKPQGRIVEVAARGAVTRDAVLEFYANTLPQLGWHQDSDGAWFREKEQLTLSFQNGAGELMVQFSLAPR